MTAEQEQIEEHAMLRAALQPLARINPRVGFTRQENSGIPVRPEEPQEAKHMRTVSVRQVFHRFGQEGSLGPEDIESARACLAKGDRATRDELRSALRPLALLPVDEKSPDAMELYRLDRVVIRPGDIREARRLLAGPAGTRPAA